MLIFDILMDEFTRNPVGKLSTGIYLLVIALDIPMKEFSLSNMAIGPRSELAFGNAPSIQKSGETLIPFSVLMSIILYLLFFIEWSSGGPRSCIIGSYRHMGDLELSFFQMVASIFQPI